MPRRDLFFLPSSSFMAKRMRAAPASHARRAGVPWGAAASTRTFMRKRGYPNRLGVFGGFTRRAGYYGRYPGELKFHDVDLDDAVVASAGTVQGTGSINLIPQGVTEIQRDGRKCTITKIQWRCRVQLPETDAAADPAQGDTLRMIMFLDKQANGATAATLDFLESTDFQSYKNLANSSRFWTIFDKTVSINYAGLASDGAGVVSQAKVTRNYSFFKKCVIPLEFDSTTGAITEIRSNNIGVLLISENGVVGFGSKIRLRFQG